MARLLDALVGDAAMQAIFSDREELAAMMRVEAALALAAAEAGLVADAAALETAQACASFEPDREDLAAGLAQDGVVVPALVRQLRSRLSEAHRGAVHFGATSQDIVDTSLVLRLAAALDLLESRLAVVVADLARLTEAEGSLPLMAHTRMQAALPFTVAAKLATWADPLLRHAERLGELRRRLLVVQLGGAVGTRDAFAGKGEAVARSLALRLGLRDGPAWHAQRDAIAEAGGWLSLVTGTLGKIGQDIALMAQSEVGAVALPPGGGSSAMPHKSNPVSAEILVALARHNAGLVAGLHHALVHEGERSGAAWTLEWLILPQMAVACASALTHAHGLTGRLSFVPPAAKS